MITGRPIEDDDKQNLRMGYYLYKYGVLALETDEEGAPAPSNYREPLPPIITAAFMYVHPGISQSASLESLSNGENTTKVKQINLLWILLLLIGIGLLTFNLTGNKYLPFLTFLLVLIYFVRFGSHFNTLFTELPAAVFIIWSSLFLQKAMNDESFPMYIASGLSLGFLVLTKAAFL